jgi:acyl carrier protein
MMEINVQNSINQVIEQIASEQLLQIPPLTDKLSLVDDLGFASLDIATLIAMLEDIFKFDPFAEGQIAITDIRTVGDLYKVYRK